MSKERELLQNILDQHEDDRFDIGSINHGKIRRLLAQPEQEPTRHALDSYWNQEAYQRGYAEAKLKLKREPLSDDEIDLGYQSSDKNYHDLAFRDGVRFADKYYGIGE